MIHNYEAAMGRFIAKHGSVRGNRSPKMSSVRDISDIQVFHDVMKRKVGVMQAFFEVSGKEG